MLPYPTAFADWVAATFLPAALGLFLASAAGKKVGPRYLAGFGLGIFLWFFVDSIQGSANLDVVLGLNGGVPQILELTLFAVGLLSTAYFAGRVLEDGKLSFTAIVLADLALGVHGFGEGSAFGAQVAQNSGSDVIQAFGGYSAALAYAGHKVLEPMMIGALLVSPSVNGAPLRTRTWRVLSLALVFSLPSILGAVSGYYIAYDSSYGFALGSGTSLFVAALLARITLSGERMGTRETLAISGAVILGYILIYGTALIHY